MNTVSFVRPVLRTLAVAALFSLLTPSLHAAAPGADMANAANKFLATLTPEQKAKSVYDLKADERQAWHFIPFEMVTFGRKGVPFRELKQDQRDLALALLRTCLSDPGYAKATNIMSLENVLKQIEKPGGKVERTPEKYCVSIYGKPEAGGTWAWRFEGHHLSLSFTIVDGKIFSTAPSFMGTNPAEVREGERKGTRVLGKEEDLARSLVKSLSDEQKSVAIYTTTAPKDIITGADRKVSPLSPDGLPYAKLNKDQQALLKQVVAEFLNRARSELVKDDFAKIEKAGWDKVCFAWAGETDAGKGHYYRVQGPTFLLEYDNTQNEANHVHAVWRDFANDFGEDILKKHYEQAHAK